MATLPLYPPPEPVTGRTAAAPGTPGDRIIGEWLAPEPGPTVVAIAGIHGNEPAGVQALQRVFAAPHPGLRRGRFVGLAGNLAALRRGVRFLEEDLNRVWLRDRITSIQAGSPPPSVDAREQQQLLEALHRIFDTATGPVHLLDLHTSSAAGIPFVCIGDTLRNRAFATRFPVPVILGLEEQVDGALLEYVNNLGHVTVGIEAGRHDSVESTEYHEAFLWLALVHAGCLGPGDVARYEQLRARLRDATRRIPRMLEVRYRHPVTPGDGFRALPGYENFQPVRKGQVLATDHTGELCAPETGRVLLPLYQGLGNDGFFLVREFRPFWLAVSAWLRRLRLAEYVHWLPGVRRTELPGVIEVDRRVARYYVVEVFHLLGFRKRRRVAGQLWFARRVE